MSDGDFYEDDEATEAVLAAYEEGAKGVTGRPAPVSSGQIEPSETFKTFVPGRSRQIRRSGVDAEQLVQA